MLIHFYRIVSSESDEEYIGSTIHLSTRWSEHKQAFNAGRHGCNSYILFAKYGIDACRIELIEVRECETKEERDRLEGDLIRASPNCVNKDTPGNTYEQWYEEHREEILARNQKYREEHREEYLAQLKAYRENPINREKRRQYTINNRDRINALMRERRRLAKLNQLVLH